MFTPPIGRISLLLICWMTIFTTPSKAQPPSPSTLGIFQKIAVPDGEVTVLGEVYRIQPDPYGFNQKWAQKAKTVKTGRMEANGPEEIGTTQSIYKPEGRDDLVHVIMNQVGPDDGISPDSIIEFYEGDVKKRVIPKPEVLIQDVFFLNNGRSVLFAFDQMKAHEETTQAVFQCYDLEGQLIFKVSSYMKCGYDDVPPLKFNRDWYLTYDDKKLVFSDVEKNQKVVRIYDLTDAKQKLVSLGKNEKLKAVSNDASLFVVLDGKDYKIKDESGEITLSLKEPMQRPIGPYPFINNGKEVVFISPEEFQPPALSFYDSKTGQLKKKLILNKYCAKLPQRYRSCHFGLSPDGSLFAMGVRGTELGSKHVCKGRLWILGLNGDPLFAKNVDNVNLKPEFSRDGQKLFLFQEEAGRLEQVFSLKHDRLEKHE